jgi:tetratricopeptide (TPR) repeat protein
MFGGRLIAGKNRNIPERISRWQRNQARLILLAGLCAPVCALQPSACQPLMDSGDALYQAFDNRGALECYSRAHQQCLESYDALMKMTRACIDVGGEVDAREAEGYYAAGLRGVDTLQQRCPDSAQSYFLRAVAAANLARIRSGTRRVAPARQIEPNVRRAVEIDPTFAPAYVVLGAYYREVAAASPVLKAFARIFLGWRPSGSLQDSDRELRRALELSPGNVYAHLELARTRLAMGKKLQAVRLLKQMPALPLTWYMDAKLKEEGRLLLVQLQR